MDAWQSLTINSTIETGDAWEHLRHQGGGAPGQPSYLVLMDGIDVAMQPTKEIEISYIDKLFVDVSASVDSVAIELSVDEKDFIVNVEKAEFEVEI